MNGVSYGPSRVLVDQDILSQFYVSRTPKKLRLGKPRRPQQFTAMMPKDARMLCGMI
jgi:hypothetical protein